MALKNKFQNKSTQSWMRYAGMSTQLMILIGLSVWGGMWLDEKIPWSMPIFTIVLPLIAIIYFLYKLIKEVSKKE